MFFIVVTFAQSFTRYTGKNCYEPNEIHTDALL